MTSTVRSRTGVADSRFLDQDREDQELLDRSPERIQQQQRQHVGVEHDRTVRDGVAREHHQADCQQDGGDRSRRPQTRGAQTPMGERAAIRAQARDDVAAPAEPEDRDVETADLEHERAGEVDCGAREHGEDLRPGARRPR